MQFNATFNNISVISWQSVLMVEETGVPRGNSCSIQTHYLDSVFALTPYYFMLSGEAANTNITVFGLI
jgi:hypothetical protein